MGLSADSGAEGHLADVAHVMGGRCGAGEAYEAALADVAKGVAEIARHVVAAGGAGSELSHVLERAHACVDGGRARRLARPATDWEALRHVLACAVPAPAWLAPLDSVRTALDKRVLAAWGNVLDAAGRVRAAWEEASRPETQRRRSVDAVFGVTRVVLRAWRECVDGARARRGVGGGVLARRTTFGNLVWSDACGGGESMVWLLLQYQRLVRAGSVAARRSRAAAGGAAPSMPPSSRARRAREEDADDAGGGQPKRQRRHDGQLRLGAAARGRLRAWLAGDGGDSGERRWPPFGDG